MQRSGGSIHLQQGLAGLRQAGATESPSSVSLSGLAGLDAAQGSLTSNALFGSLNLEELMSSREMEQQGQQLLASMRAAEAQQRSLPGSMMQQQQQPQPSLPQHLQQATFSAPAPAAPVPPFAGFPQPADTQSAQHGRSADDIWRGLGVELGGAWNGPAHPPAVNPTSDSQQRAQTAQQQGGSRSPTLAPDLGGYLPGGHGHAATGGNPDGGRGGNGAMLAALGSNAPSLSSLSSTGLTHNLGGLGVGSSHFTSSGSMEVASQLASAGASAWHSQLSLQQQESALAAARSAAGLPPIGAASYPAAAANLRLQHAADAGGISPRVAGFSDGAHGLPPGNASLQGTPVGSPADVAGFRRGSYPGIGGGSSPRFSSHGSLPPANALYAASFPGADAPPTLNPHLHSGGFGADDGLAPAADRFGRAMAPPPLPAAGARSGRAAAESRSADASPDVLSVPPSARRSRSAARTQSSGRSSQTLEDPSFPEIPASVPRVRARPQPQPEQLASLSSRERHKATKGKLMSVNDKELRDLKRKEANRESAARSRDKRLKLIADLEVEVRTLREQHQEFKRKIIESTVPRPLLRQEEDSQKALRRVHTDPVECEAQIRAALLKEGLNLKELAALVPSAAAVAAAPPASAAPAAAAAAAACSAAAPPAAASAAVSG